MENKEKTEKRAKIALITSVVVIAFFAIGFWGIILTKTSPTLASIAERSIALITNLFSGNEESITINVNPSLLETGGSSTISVVHNNPSSDDGVYAIAFGCVTDVTYRIDPTAIFSPTEEQVRCGSYYRIKDISMPIQVTLSSPAIQNAEVSVFVSYFDGATIVVRGTNTITVTNESLPATTNSGTSTSSDSNSLNTDSLFSTSTDATEEVIALPVSQSTQSPTQPLEQTPVETVIRIPVPNTTPTAVPGGKPELEPKLLDTGTLDRLTNEYTATTSFSRVDRVAIRFEVTNTGTARANNWYFSAQLPTYPAYMYTSDTQQSLNPGERIEFTIAFDQVTAGEKAVTINVDPGKQVSGDNPDNNKLVVPLFTQN